MKVAFYVFAVTCLINSLTAVDLSAFDTNTDTENFESNFLNFVAPDDDNVKELSPNLNFPPRPPHIISTTRGTTTFRPSSSEIPTSPPTSTTTPRPRPPSPKPTTTPRPLPPSPSPLRNPQIYNNRAEALGPFAGRLINLVLNKGGRQKTVQENQILYNIKSTGPKFLDEKLNE